MTVYLSTEILAHFECGECYGWWTVGDWIKTDKVFCPHCHEEHFIFKPANPIESTSKTGTTCGGCGNSDPDKRCLGCHHIF